MKRSTLTLAVSIAATAATLALAQNRTPAPPSSPPKAQAQPAQDQAGSAIQTCVACHGERGEGNPSAGVPRITGQAQAYLQHQLESYANGSRRNPVMEPIAKGLSRAARAAAAEHYARVQPPATQARQDAGTHERGALLAVRGDERRQIQACANCHGPGGIGEPPEIPYVAGLDAAYITSTLNAFRTGARRNDAGQQMRTVARALSADDVNAVAQYFASLAPPARPAPENIVRAPAGPGPMVGGAGRGAPAASTQQPAAPGGAVGSEQGAGTTGGTQGAGGVDQSSTTTRPEPSKSK